ncbi:MAG: dihydrolipoamide acetyltransferase family protein [Thermoprotei archaeon]|jgi:pyruvate/2-oxoglutarate dehydrogenase complex dihydrolipoamide acyltransferase (E2) component
MTDVFAPRVDPSTETIKLLKWKKKDGDVVNAGDSIATVEGAKTTFDVKAPVSGTLKILVAEGSRVKVGTKIAELGRRSLSVRTPKIRERVPLDGIRRTISERLSYSHREIPAAYLTADVNMSSVLSDREKRPSKPSINAYIVKACATALMRHPYVNSIFEEETILIADEANVCVAVDTPRGLYAPVIGQAETKTLSQITSEISELAQKARDGQIELYDLTGGTFTVSNLGSFGVEFFVPIINPPQTAILGVGRVRENGHAYFTLSMDHRVFDGAEGARFLSDLKKELEEKVSSFA